MSLRVGVVMDPIGQIKPIKDTTLAMLLEARRRNWEIRYMELPDLFLRDGQCLASHRALDVKDSLTDWFDLGDAEVGPLGEMDVVLMRKDPPFNMDYIYATYLLERAEHGGALVVNQPAALRDVSEKAYTAWFPQCCPPTLVTGNITRLRDFLEEQSDIIVKPLDGMGGTSVYRIVRGDVNTSVILESLTLDGRRYVMAQRYLPEIAEGDKRILLIDGEPFPYALARLPAAGETRANLAAGGRGEGRALTERDRWICSEVGPVMKKKGLIFVGLDVIGNYLTEINVTSPTCVRELDRAYDANISAILMDCIQARLAHRSP